MQTLLLAAQGAGRTLAPIGAGDHEASELKEKVFGFLLISLSIAIVIGVVIVIVGI
jgi:hydroxylaminobenzene mutase